MSEVTITRADDYREAVATATEEGGRCWVGSSTAAAAVETQDIASLQSEIDNLRALMDECVDGGEVSRFNAHNRRRHEVQKRIDALRAAAAVEADVAAALADTAALKTMSWLRLRAMRDAIQKWVHSHDPRANAENNRKLNLYCLVLDEIGERNKQVEEL